eukprot:g16903.t1
MNSPTSPGGQEVNGLDLSISVRKSFYFAINIEHSQNGDQVQVQPRSAAGSKEGHTPFKAVGFFFLTDFFFLTGGYGAAIGPVGGIESSSSLR